MVNTGKLAAVVVLMLGYRGSAAGACLLAAMLGCGDARAPYLTVDGGDAARPGDQAEADLPAETCAPACGDRQCGDDGCGGQCGLCAQPEEECSVEGFCLRRSCGSSKDCPGALVCDPELGECVECVGDEDCGRDWTCGPDRKCHETIACASDKDCKSAGLVCDKTAGKCVECVSSDDCPGETFCSGSFCLADVCDAGSTVCHDNSVQECSAEGGEWILLETCAPGEVCSDRDCLAQVCAPGAIFCVGQELRQCDASGTVSSVVQDCGAMGWYCIAGECVQPVCIPGTVFCLDDNTSATCKESGLEYSPAACPAGTYCTDGACEAWVCTPGGPYCVDDLAVECNAAGSAVLSEEDCAAEGLYCVEGQCIENLCKPGSLYCQDEQTSALCHSDGMGRDLQPCPVQTFCLAGVCLPWICVPETASCDGDVAKTCNAHGNGYTGQVDCAALGQECLDGACGGSCGDCDDLDPCTLDVCDAGTCGHSEVPGCCLADAECGDNDPCTADACVLNVCQHVTTCCVTHEECASADACLFGFCSDGSCAGLPTNAQGCCPKTPLWNGFEAGIAAGWDVTSNNAANGWFISADQAHGGKYSLAASEDDEVSDFLATMPPVNMSLPGAVLSFWVRPSHSHACDSLAGDRVQVEVNATVAYVVCTPPGQWSEVEVDLSPWAGQAVVVAFRYVRQQSVCCSPVSFWIDDVSVDAPCCQNTGQCEDDDPCTADLCWEDGECVHMPVPSCCQDQPWSLGFEPGSPGGWWTDSNLPANGWSLATDQAHGGKHAIRATEDDLASNFRLVLPPLKVANGGTALAFWMRPSANHACDSLTGDRLQVEVNGAVAYIGCTPAGQWSEVKVDLSAWTGQTVEAAFRFLRQKSVCCSPVSVWIDDIRLEGPCCQTSGLCDDGDPCTADTCSAGGQCEHSEIPGCCPTPAWLLDFEAGSPGGWSTEGNLADNGWTVVTDQAHSGKYALGASEDDKASDFRLVLPPLALPNNGAVLAFWFRPASNHACDSLSGDRLQVEVNGVVTYVGCSPAGQWSEVKIDLSAWTGQTVEAAFRYVRQQSVCCSPVSMWIDDIRLESPCCKDKTQCDDGAECTMDSCATIGQCLHVLVPWCCPTSAWGLDFESGSPGGWWTESNVPGAGWTISTDQVHGGKYAIRATEDDLQSNSRLVLPPLDVPNSGAALAFWMRPSANHACDSLTGDRLQAEINGAVAYIGCTPAGQWSEVKVDLSAWTGQTVEAAFRFVRQKSVCCGPVSAWVDDIRLELPCCLSAAQCNDGLACTTDACAGGGKCSHTPTPGCVEGPAWGLDFEAGSPGGWWTESNLADNGWTVVSDQVHSGKYAVGMSEDDALSNARAVLPLLGIPAEGATLSFWVRPSHNHACDSLSGDRLQVEVNGAVTYVTCTPAGQWSQVSVDLYPWAGKKAEIGFRYVRNKSVCCSPVSFWVDEVELSVAGAD